MSTALKRVHYPDDDGLPRADNDWQFRWIVLLYVNLAGRLAHREDVFVAGNHLIYPVTGRPEIRQAPDVYVAFGAPNMPRGSYKVWEENGVFPQVVFEVWSPNNRVSAMEDKHHFYERYGAEEYYIVYPEFPMHVDGWLRAGDRLVRQTEKNGFVSPRLGIRFVLDVGYLTVFGPNGRPFQAAADIVAERNAQERAAAVRDRSARLAAKLRELGVDPDAV